MRRRAATGLQCQQRRSLSGSGSGSSGGDLSNKDFAHRIGVLSGQGDWQACREAAAAQLAAHAAARLRKGGVGHLNRGLCTAMAACTRAGRPSEALALAEQAAFALDAASEGAALAALGRAGRVDEAAERLARNAAATSAHFNTVMHACVEAGRTDEVPALAAEMRRRGVPPCAPALTTCCAAFVRLARPQDALRAAAEGHEAVGGRVFSGLVSALMRAHCVAEGLATVDRMDALGFEAGPAVLSAAVSGLQNFSSVHGEGFALGPTVARLLARAGSDVEVHTAAMHVYGRASLVGEACRVFDQLEAEGVERNAKCCTVMMAALCAQGRHAEALRVFDAADPSVPDEAMRNVAEDAAHALGVAVPLLQKAAEVNGGSKEGGGGGGGGGGGSVIAHTMSLRRLGEAGKWEEALDLHRRAAASGVPPLDTVAVHTAARLCQRAGRPAEGLDVLRGLAEWDSACLTLAARCCSARGGGGWDAFHAALAGRRWWCEEGLGTVLMRVCDSEGPRAALRFFAECGARGLENPRMAARALDVCRIGVDSGVLREEADGVVAAAEGIVRAMRAPTAAAVDSFLEVCAGVAARGCEVVAEAASLVEDMWPCGAVDALCGVKLVRIVDAATGGVGGCDVLRALPWHELPCGGERVYEEVMHLAVGQQRFDVLRTAYALHPSPAAAMELLLAQKEHAHAAAERGGGAGVAAGKPAVSTLRRPRVGQQDPAEVWRDLAVQVPRQRARRLENPRGMESRNRTRV
eukprot:Rhum_TRINITY_DN13519_c0_g1::Rhum_TRINITY_DN13519_c0_g1_i1::g.60860::m.60860